MSKKTTGKRGGVPQTFSDIAIAVALVGSVFITMFAFTGNWPPLVVIESKSMQHSGTESMIGIMDTGDLTMVKSVSSESDITTYVSGMISGYRTYGDYGDVVIYWRGGDRDLTPIIHRAVVFLDANDDGSYSAPELQPLTEGADYRMTNATNSWSRITDDFVLLNYGYRGADITIPVENMLRSMSARGIDPGSGFITKGDFNTFVDQASYIAPGEPVSFDWIHGIATGEIPWFGAIKLFMTGSLPADTPANTIILLWTSIALIVAIPVGSEAYIWWRGRKEGAGQEKEQMPDDAPPSEKADEKK